MRILFIGDIVGRPGRVAVKTLLPQIREEFLVDFVVANAENAAGGLGATPEIIQELLGLGVQAITLGNHTWRKKSLVPSIHTFASVLRPANYPDGVPGKGTVVMTLPDGRKIGLLNLLGRVYMDPFACPFETARRELARLRKDTDTLIVDMHAEATSEKTALAFHLDGQCTAVIGTHTHVQTADERILPSGTAFITDAGMTGPAESVIGMDPDRAIKRFTTGMPSEFKVASGRARLCGVVVESDDETGRAKSIERLVRIAN